MSHQEFQSQAVDRILSEDSILQLIKDLASAFGRPNYVGVYEGLLTKKPQKGFRLMKHCVQNHCMVSFKQQNYFMCISIADLDHKYVLAMCIRNAGGDQNRTERLLSLIGGLSGVEQGREIVQFLALMGKKVVSEKSDENKSCFSVPKEMLDGSLFNKLPREDCPRISYRSQFAFDAAPGTDLPLISKYIHPEKYVVVKVCFKNTM
jgi:hypothetical protein